MTIHRQARRITDDDSDELVLIEAYGEWWIARRISDRVVVLAYGDDLRADLGFDDQLEELSPRGAWTEAQPAL